jgi:hypothetical protein
MQGRTLVEIFLARSYRFNQSHVASDFCGSFEAKQHSLFPLFNLLERLERQSHFSKLFCGNSSIGVEMKTGALEDG